MTEKLSYKQGFLDGVRAYAWYKDGKQQVGTTGRTLKDALEKVEETWNYAPPNAAGPSALARPETQEAQACCQDFESCRRPCTPRGVELGKSIQVAADKYAAGPAISAPDVMVLVKWRRGINDAWQYLNGSTFQRSEMPTVMNCIALIKSLLDNPLYATPAAREQDAAPAVAEGARSHGSQPSQVAAPDVAELVRLLRERWRMMTRADPNGAIMITDAEANNIADALERSSGQFIPTADGISITQSAAPAATPEGGGE